ncbi:MAG: 30S ribosomal protein S4e [Methanocellales archaeon]|nr:30S ribosomal protein S4e [Methanocellales archaeon]
MHRKRVSAPTAWPIARKTHKWVVTPRLGPHKTCMPLAIILRDVLKLGDNIKEVKHMLNDGQVLVDGVVRRDHRFPVGIFDVISIPVIKKHYRVVFDSKGRFIPIPVKDPTLKLCRVNNKTMIKGGKILLNLHDGSNVIATNEYRPGDSVVLELPQRKIKQRLERKPGNLAMITGGRHLGEVGTIKELKLLRSSQPNMVVMENDKEFEVIEDYVCVVGTKKPAIELGE